MRCYKAGATEKDDAVKDPTMEAFAASALALGEYTIYYSDSASAATKYDGDKLAELFPLGNDSVHMIDETFLT